MDMSFFHHAQKRRAQLDVSFLDNPEEKRKGQSFLNSRFYLKVKNGAGNCQSYRYGIVDPPSYYTTGDISYVERARPIGVEHPLIA
jgi:hypothetical protein